MISSFDSFINQSDPTKNIENELTQNVTLANQYSRLSEKDKELVFCKLNGYFRVPPSMEQLYSDDYYLGGSDFYDGGSLIYDFWKTSLKDIVSGPVTKKPYLVLSGAIGIGKSTVSKLLMSLTHARLLCMKNPYRTLGIAPKPLTYLIGHRNEETAYTEFVKFFKDDILVRSPFFKNNPAVNFKYKFTTNGYLGSFGIGSDVLFYIISEVNFFPGNHGQRAVSTALGRLSSRFDSDVLHKVGFLILDSSAAGENACTEWFLDNADKDMLYHCQPKHWEVKPGSYKASNGQTFPVYTGDGKYPPQILPADYKLYEDQDPDRVLNVPMQLYSEAKIDLGKLLMDKAGISIGSSDAFMPNLEHAVNCMKLKNYTPEIIVVDFFDKTDRLWDKICKATFTLPKDTPLWIGLDLAVAGDFAGISAVTFDGWDHIGEARTPRIKCIFSLAVARKEGQQTSLVHFEDLILEMKKKFSVTVSADQAFSRQLLQDLEREGVRTRYISTDNSPCEPAMYLKNMILSELISIPYNKRLLREMHDLKYTYTNTGKVKIDHPKKATQDEKVFDINNGVGSKDVWDSLASACYSMKQSVDEGEEQGFNCGVTKQLEIYNNMTSSSLEETQKIFQNIIEGIY